MTRSALERIADIRAAVDAIHAHEKLGRDAPAVFDAVRMRLLEIGEAASGIEPAVRALAPDIPWSEIIGMRNWMAHRYFDTVYSYVWSTVDHDLTPLIAELDCLEDHLSDT